MATPFTFGNLLKFGLDSCHNAKGRPTFLHWERGNTWSPTWTTSQTLLHTRKHLLSSSERGGLQQAPLHMRERCHGGWLNEGPQRLRWFFRYLSRSGVNRLATPLGIDESLAFRAFDKTVILGHWLSKDTEIGIGLQGFPFEKGFYYILVDYFFLKKKEKKSFSKKSFSKREALRYFYMGLYHFPHMPYSFPHMLYSFPSHANIR